MPGGTSNPQGSNGTLNAPGTGGITNAPLYGTPAQQMADPLHLFPSPMPDNSAPARLPNLGINPTFYSANSFAPRPMNGGIFNNMAARLAGPQYVPRVNNHPVTPKQPGFGGQPVAGGGPDFESFLSKLFNYNPSNPLASMSPMNPLGKVSPISQIGKLF